MSIVTGIMLILGPGDWVPEVCSPDEAKRYALNYVQKWLAERYNGHQLVDLSDHAGGGKHPQFEAWSAGINYFDEEDFVSFVLSLDWESPENLVLVIQPEEGPVQVHRMQVLAPLPG